MYATPKNPRGKLCFPLLWRKSSTINKDGQNWPEIVPVGQSCFAIGGQQQFGTARDATECNEMQHFFAPCFVPRFQATADARECETASPPSADTKGSPLPPAAEDAAPDFAKFSKNHGTASQRSSSQRSQVIPDTRNYTYFWFHVKRQKRFFQVPGRRQTEGFLARQRKPELAHLTDPFAERMVALAKVVGSAVRTELGLMSPRPAGED